MRPRETDNELEADMDRIVREAECKRLTGLSRTTRWELERRGQFPARRRLSINSVGWLESELQAWVEGRQRGRIKMPTSMAAVCPDHRSGGPAPRNSRSEE